MRKNNLRITGVALSLARSTKRGVMSRTYRPLFVAIAVSLASASCAHKKVYRNLSAWNETPNQSVELSVRAMKRKSSRADVTVAVRNMYPFTVVIPEDSIRLTINGEQGAGGELPRLVLKSGDMISKVVIFQLAAREPGAATVRLEHITQGETVVVSGVKADSKTHSLGIVGGNRAMAVGVGNSNTSSTSESYSKKSAVEGQDLPPVEISVPE